MRVKAYLKHYRFELGCVGVAALVTGVFYFTDYYRTQQAQSDSLLKWARQVSTQAKGLALAAGSKAEQDPVGWAAGLLDQGADPRVLRVFKWKTSAGQSQEIYDFNDESRLFEYKRALVPEEGVGVRLQIEAPYEGFLGTRSPFANDFMVGFFFVSLCLALVLLPRIIFPKKVFTFPQKEMFLEWVKRARELLTQMGVHLRELIRSTQGLVNAATHSRQALQSLRASVQDGVLETQQTQKYLNESEALLVGAEAMVLNLIIEAARLGDQGKHFSEMAEQLHRSVQKTRQLNQRAALGIGHVEAQVKPWVSEVDRAHQFYADFSEISQKMNEQITQSSGALGGQAEHLQKFAQDIVSMPQSQPELNPAQVVVGSLARFVVRRSKG